MASGEALVRPRGQGVCTLSGVDQGARPGHLDDGAARARGGAVGALGHGARGGGTIGKQQLGPGAFLGELGLLDKGPRTATVIAQGPVETLVLGPREFAGLLDEVPSISHKLLKALAARIRELDAKAYG